MVPISTSDSLRITPWPRTSMPRRPARPMSWVLSPVDARLLLGRGQVELVVGAPLQRLPAAAPGEDEVDRGHHLPARQLLDHGQHVVGGQPPVLVDPVGGLLLLGGAGPGPLVDLAV